VVDEEHLGVFQSPAALQCIFITHQLKRSVHSRRVACSEKLEILKIYESFNSGGLVVREKNWESTLARKCAPQRLG